MGLLNLYNRLMGRPARTPEPPPLAIPIPAPRAPQAVVARAVLHRDEIIDARTRIAGYRFYVNAPGAHARVPAAALAEALKEEAIASFAKRRLAVIPVSLDDWHAADFRQFVGPNTLFLISAPDTELDLEGWLTGVQDMRTAGARIVVQGVRPTSQLATIMQLCDVALIDFREYALRNLESFVHALRNQYPGVALAVDHVPTWPERRLCVACGAEYCLGEFPRTVEMKDDADEMDKSRVVLMDMLNVLRSGTDMAQLAAVAKRDPAVTLQLLQMANASAHGLSKSVTGLEQAVMVLGREHLYRWISIAMFKVGGDRNRDESLLELALARGRFLELIGLATRSKAEAEELFLVGLLSMMDCLLGMAMQAILAKISLPNTIEEVLQRNEGPYARYLSLALAVERGRTEQWMRLADALQIGAEQIEAGNSQALTWAEEAMSAQQS